MLKIGLTGGMGSGKSTVAEILAAQGALLIDADAVSRAATQSGGAAMAAIKDAFGTLVMARDGSLNRDAMRQIMLSDTNAKARLEAILHPLIGQRINQLLRQAHEAGAPIAVLDIPLLVEGGARWRSRLDAIWVVDCLPQTQVSRVLMRSGWPLSQIEAVMNSQASRAQRLACADAVIFNENLNLKQLEHMALALLHAQKLGGKL